MQNYLFDQRIMLTGEKCLVGSAVSGIQGANITHCSCLPKNPPWCFLRAFVNIKLLLFGSRLASMLTFLACSSFFKIFT